MKKPKADSEINDKDVLRYKRHADVSSKNWTVHLRVKSNNPKALKGFQALVPSCNFMITIHPSGWKPDSLKSSEHASDPFPACIDLFVVMSLRSARFGRFLRQIEKDSDSVIENIQPKIDYNTLGTLIEEESKTPDLTMNIYGSLPKSLTKKQFETPPTEPLTTLEEHQLNVSSPH